MDSDKFVEEFDAQFENVFEQTEIEQPKLPSFDMMSPILPVSPILPHAEHSITCLKNERFRVWNSPQGTSQTPITTANRTSLRKFAQHQSIQQQQQQQCSSHSIKQTPKTSRKMHNPFESIVLESLTSDMCSPGMFRRTKRKKEGFQWTIEHKAVLCPANFAENEQSPSSSTSEFRSPGFEQKAQSALNHYWQNVHFLPSPEPDQLSRRTEDDDMQKYHCD